MRKTNDKKLVKASSHQAPNVHVPRISWYYASLLAIERSDRRLASHDDLLLRAGCGEVGRVEDDVLDVEARRLKVVLEGGCWRSEPHPP